MVEEEMK
jgi:hypothetical protein